MTVAESGNCWLTWMVKERLDSTGGRPGRYEAVTFSYVMVPEAGQPAGAAPPPCFTVGGSCNQLSQSETKRTHDYGATSAHTHTTTFVSSRWYSHSCCFQQEDVMPFPHGR